VVQITYCDRQLVVQIMMGYILLKSVEKHIPRPQSLSIVGLASELSWDVLRIINRICTRKKSQGTSLGQFHTYFRTQLIGTTKLQQNTYLFSQDFRIYALASDSKATGDNAKIAGCILSNLINLKATFSNLILRRGLSYG